MGPEYVGDFSVVNGQPAMTIERPYGRPAPNKVVVYGAGDQPARHLEVKATMAADDVPAPALDTWQMATMAESNPDFDDSSWKMSDDPQQMGADEDTSAFAWYRATVNAPKAGTTTINFPGAADHLIVFVNGKLCPATPSIVDPKPTGPELRDGEVSWTAPLDLKAGRNSIAVLATHQGRDKGGGVQGHGPIDHFFPKGIFKPVYLITSGQRMDIKGWRMHGGLHDPSMLSYRSLASTDSPAFYSTTFTATQPAVGPHPILRFPTDALTRGTIFLNGHCLGRYPAILNANKKPLGMYLPECWLAADGRNRLVVFDEEGKSPAQTGLTVEKEASREVIAVSSPADPTAPIELPPYQQNDLRETTHLNIATDKPVTVSSSDPDNNASNINDGDDMTFWSPATPPTPDHPAWFMIDLQKSYSLGHAWMNLRAEMSLHPYLIEGSSDGQTWKSMADTRGAAANVGKGDPNSIPLTNGSNTRYVRVTFATASEDNRPFSVYDFGVWEVGK